VTFEEAFRRINGRTPTDAEVKDALALADVLKQADLDPMLLLVMADAKAKAEREQMVVDMRSIARDTVATIRAGLPTNPEWAKAAAWATTLTRATGWQAAILGGTAALCLAVGLLFGVYLDGAIAAKANHERVCAETHDRVLQIADYAERKLHSHALANEVRGLQWNDCK